MANLKPLLRRHNVCVVFSTIAFYQLTDNLITAYSFSNLHWKPNQNKHTKSSKLSYSDSVLFPTPYSATSLTTTTSPPHTIRHKNNRQQPTTSPTPVKRQVTAKDPTKSNQNRSSDTYTTYTKELPASLLKSHPPLHIETSRTPSNSLAAFGPQTLSVTAAAAIRNPLEQLIQAIPTEKLSVSYIRQKAERIGIYPFLVYNIISQINSGTTMSLAWYLFGCKTGVSPFYPSQWKVFLAFYTPFLIANNVLRPLRLAAAVALTKHFERAVTFCQNRFSCLSQKTHAIAATTIVIYAGAVCYSASCFFMASLLSGVPVFGGGGLVVVPPA